MLLSEARAGMWPLSFFEMSTSQGSFPHLIKSARLRQTNDFHVIIWIGGLWMPPFPHPAYYYITAASQFWFFKWISWGVVFFFFLQMQMCWLHSKPTEWKFLLFFFFKASNVILRQAQRGDFCLFVCLSKQGLLSASDYIERCSWPWTLSFSNSIIINIISGVTLTTTTATNGAQRWFLQWEMTLCSGKSVLLIWKLPKSVHRLWSH